MFLNCGTGEGPSDFLGQQIKPVSPKEINPEYSVGGLMMKL